MLTFALETEGFTVDNTNKSTAKKDEYLFELK